MEIAEISSTGNPCIMSMCKNNFKRINVMTLKVVRSHIWLYKIVLIIRNDLYQIMKVHYLKTSKSSLRKDGGSSVT